jgi:hypothetical protein
MGVLTSGPHGWLGRQFDEWRTRHGYQRGMAWSATAVKLARCGYCGKPAHGSYVWPDRKGTDHEQGR